MKKALLVLLSLFIVSMFASCHGPDKPPDAPPETSEADAEEDSSYVQGTGINDVGADEVGKVTDFVPGEVELHEVILPWEEDGEAGEEPEADAAGDTAEAKNPYYTKTINDEGEYVYAVLKASNHQPAYLPVGRTVLYTSESGECYYEKMTNTYKYDGQEMSEEQYQLHVTG